MHACNGPVKLIDLLDPVLMICRERETSSTTRSSSSRQDVAALALTLWVVRRMSFYL